MPKHESGSGGSVRSRVQGGQSLRARTRPVACPPFHLQRRWWARRWCAFAHPTDFPSLRAKRSNPESRALKQRLDCFVASAPRNDSLATHARHPEEPGEAKAKLGVSKDGRTRACSHPSRPAAARLLRMRIVRVATTFRLSVFKNNPKTILDRSPQARLWGTELATTLGLKRQKILITFLIEHRKAAGMTQTQLADRLGKSRSFITRLESGQRRVYVVELMQLAEVLGFDAGKVMGAVSKAV